MSEEIKVISVDSENIEKDENYPGAYTVCYELSDAPDAIWKQCFDRAWYNTFFLTKRPVVIGEKRLKITVIANDSMQEQTDFLKLLLGQANIEYGIYSKQMQLEKRIIQEEQKKVDEDKNKIREMLKDIKI